MRECQSIFYRFFFSRWRSIPSAVTRIHSVHFRSPRRRSADLSSAYRCFSRSCHQLEYSSPKPLEQRRYPFSPVAAAWQPMATYPFPFPFALHAHAYYWAEWKTTLIVGELQLVSPTRLQPLVDDAVSEFEFLTYITSARLLFYFLCAHAIRSRIHRDQLECSCASPMEFGNFRYVRWVVKLQASGETGGLLTC